ncbi:MAG TPA: cytochrome c family protein, partial [Sphingomonadaceae bacterium]
MTDRSNTIFGWLLFCGIIALGLSHLSAAYFRAGKEQRPATMGYAIAGVVEEGAGAASGPSFTELLATADPAAGEKVFAKCMACHTIDQGAPNGIGPNLYGTVGEDIGKGKGGFAFSDALSGKGGKWTFDNLDKWLTSPKAFAPGTKMTFAGLPDAKDRANVVAFLNSKGSNLPLPKPEAKPAAAASGAATP